MKYFKKIAAHTILLPIYLVSLVVIILIVPFIIVDWAFDEALK